MELRVYDNELNLRHIIENFTSLTWTRKYNECGSFRITAPRTKDNVDALKPGLVVWVQGKADAGIIESLTIEAQSGVERLTAEGRFLPSIMDRRLINLNFSGRVEKAMRDIFLQVDPFPNVELGADNGFPDLVDFQAIYKDLLSYEQNLAKSANFGFRFRPDMVGKKIYFEIFKGVDRTFNQSDRARVVFSDEYENLSGARYSYNSQLEKNVCVVGGQSNGDYKVYETVGDTSSTGYNRRETYYEASDVLSEGTTWIQYIAALRARGQMILEQSRESETFECTIRPNGNFVYLQDYDIGDVVTAVKTEWGIKKDLRITEVTEVYETNIPKIQLTLGAPLPTTIDWGV